MLALVRVPVLFIYFLLLNIVLLLACIVRPFHRDNVYIGGALYGTMAPILGLKIVVRGQENVPDSPCIFIGNHQNSFDLITICKAVPKGTVTVGKKSLVWIPVFGWLYWLAGNILIDRKNASRAVDTLRATVNKIKERAISVWLFPEGTRSYGRDLLPFKVGAFRIASEANLPIVSICASDLHDKVKLNRWNNGTLIMEFGKPVTMDDSKSMKEWPRYFHAQMKEDFARLNSEVAELDAAE